jgi:hypothetical protein
VPGKGVPAVERALDHSIDAVVERIYPLARCRAVLWIHMPLGERGMGEARNLRR